MADGLEESPVDGTMGTPTPTGGQGAWCQLGRTSKYRGGQQEETPGNVPSISLNTKTQHPVFAQETFNHFMHKVRFSLMLLLIQDRRNNAVNVCRYLDPPFTELEISRGRRSQCKCGGSAAPSAVKRSIGEVVQSRRRPPVGPSPG